MGGWPVLLGDAWDQNEFVWTEMIYKFREAGYGFDSIIDFSITPDVKNSTKRVIYIDQASLVLDRPVFMEGFNNSIIDAYYSYMVDIAEMFGANRFRALTELKESLAFEMNLAKISVPDEERRNVTKLYNPMTVSELTNKYPTIPWREYLSKMLPSSITVEDDEVVIVMAPSYFDNLEKLLDAIPKRVQANYLMWRAIAENLRFLHNDVLNRRQQFFTVLYGNTERQARTDECTSTVAERLSISVAAMYVKQYFKEDAKKNAVAMVADIRRQFYHILGRIDWMDEKTRVKALHKASAMVAHIGYPDELLDDRKVNEFYRNFDISGDNYLENILNHNKLEADRTFGTLREPVNKTEWINHARSAVINAYNYPQLNSIEFTAAILRGAFFDNDRPNYMNYGGIGFIIGHEITHGFDDVGKGFDADGELDNWWDATTDDNFHQRAQCIIEQYSNYTVPEIGMNLNGIKTQGENIADNGGIKIAYLAYKSWVERNKPEKRLPGIDRTPEQMFWLSAANAWCAKVKREALAMDVVSEMHSPDEFRVFGPFSNMPEFANDYKCPKGSRMNPEKKCSLW
ncbi:VLP3p-5, transcript variant X2 [Venturia canescens]|nr:neprilysin-2-like isoform X2 [Venturia canescens]KAI5630580.1 VLP3p-5, transcript variant X2 [Venturia canescens]